MSSRREIVLVCDLCGKDEKEVDVSTHTLTVDGRAIEAEACVNCWWSAVKGIAPLNEHGRPIKPQKAVRARVKHRNVVGWPGTPWQFTSHALKRMGERYLAPLDVIAAADEPETSHDGLEEGLKVHFRNGHKVVVDPVQRIIVTAAARDSIEAHWNGAEPKFSG